MINNINGAGPLSKKTGVIFLLLTMLFFNGCGVYSFTGASIDSNVKTVRIPTFGNQASLVIPALSQKLTLQLKTKFTTGTSLAFTDNPAEADLEFNGNITGYTVTPQAAQAGETAALTRITVTVSVDFKNNKNPKQNWSNSFSFYQDFDSNKDISTVLDGLLDTICEQLADDIFNKAVVNW
jgi:hypothetical protein